MKPKWMWVGLGLIALVSVGTNLYAGSWEIDLESGMANSGYNVVRIPGDEGTQISLNEAFDIAPQIYWRAKIFYQLNQEHGVGILVAPLNIETEGIAPFPVRYEDQIFPANTPLKAVYRFDSYRLTYRYRFWKTTHWLGHIGFTAKIRDAEISLEGNGIKAKKVNTGFVPLLYLRVAWNVTGPWSVILDADALAAPQGRAEDVMLAVQYQADEHWKVRMGYRGVEGGSDSDAVYSFAAIHYALLGVTAIY